MDYNEFSALLDKYADLREKWREAQTHRLPEHEIWLELDATRMKLWKAFNPDESEPKKTRVTSVKTYAGKTLEEMTKEELRQYAKDNRIALYTNVRENMIKCIRRIEYDRKHKGEAFMDEEMLINRYGPNYKEIIAEEHRQAYGC